MEEILHHLYETIAKMGDSPILNWWSQEFCSVSSAIDPQQLDDSISS